MTRRGSTAVLLLSMGATSLAWSSPTQGQDPTDQLISETKAARAAVEAAATTGEPMRDKVEMLRLKTSQLLAQAELEASDAKQAAALAAAKDAEQTADGVVAEKIADAIGKAPRPMIAVLMAPDFERASFELQSVGATSDSNGVVRRTSSGGIAGLLVAAEVPFAFPKTPWGTFLPVGAWFGAQLQSGGGQSIDSVDLATGFSLTLISKARLAAMLKESDGTLSGPPARLLIGVAYGDQTRLASGISEGDELPTGQAVPIEHEARFSATIGLGFRF